MVTVEEIVPQDDGLHTYISAKFPLLGADGKPYAVCGIATDITEYKRAEEKLRLDAVILQNVGESIYLIGLEDGIIKYANCISVNRRLCR